MALVKIKVTAYKDAECTKQVDYIEAFINPDTYSTSVKVKYADSKTIDNPNPTKIFAGLGDETLTLGKIIVDGTGIINTGKPFKDVYTYIQHFRDIVCKFNGGIHSTNFLKITWNKLSFICVCTSFDVKYTLFKPDGTPLRAEITLSLSRSEDFSTKEKRASKQSPDLTHLRVFKAGDTLPLMCYRIYGDSSYYLDVARKNNLDNVFDIQPGTALYFYPLKK